MHLKEIKAFFCFFMFFTLTILKSNSIKFRFSLTWRHTNYQTIKFSPSIYKIQKETKSKYMNYRKQPPKRFFTRFVLWQFNPKINTSIYLRTNWFFRENWYRPVTLPEPNSFTVSCQAFLFQNNKHFCFRKMNNNSRQGSHFTASHRKTSFDMCL